MNKKIKIVYDASLLSYNYQKTSSRSGIFFVAMNILQEMLNHDDIEIYLYASQSLMYGLKKFKESNPKYANVNIIGKCTAINYFLGMLEFWKYTCRKLDQKDNLIKKIVRFLTNRLLKLIKFYNEKNYYLKNNIEYDVLFSPVEKIPNFLKNTNTKSFIILYDATPIVLPKYNPASDKNSWFMRLFESLNKDDYYFAISEYTKQDFIKYCPNIDANKIYVTPLACNESFRPKDEKSILSVKTKYNIPLDKKYIFSLCTLEPRKNLIRAVKTFIEFIKKNNIDDLIFVLGGGHWQMFIDQLNSEIEDLGIYKDKIIKAGYIDDEDLAPLYSGAEWFVYTSMYEGFGLPPLEAMSCGCPVITSNNTSLPEVVGDAGLMIDWDSDEQHIQAYEKYYFNPELRKNYAQKGLERSAHFSWKKCADKMVEVMKQNL